MTPEQMRRAAEIFERDADMLRRCNTDEAGNWMTGYGEIIGKEDYDEYLALARLLREQADAIDTDLLAERTRLLHAAEERIAELEALLWDAFPNPSGITRYNEPAEWWDKRRALLHPQP